MSRKNGKRARKKQKKMRKVSSLRDVELLLEMHGEKANYKTRICALLHAGSIYNTLMKKVEQKDWTVKGIEHLEPLVETHRASAASSRILDMMIREMVSPDAAPGAAGIAGPSTAPGEGLAVADSILEPGAAPADSVHTPGAAGLADLATARGAGLADPVLARGTAPADSVPTLGAAGLADPVLGRGAAPANPVPSPGAADLDDLATAAPGAGFADAIAPRMLIHATRLVEAGAAFGQIRIGSKFVRILVHGLGAKIEETGQAIMTVRHTQAAALTNLHQVKHTLHQVWNMRVRS